MGVQGNVAVTILNKNVMMCQVGLLVVERGKKMYKLYRRVKRQSAGRADRGQQLIRKA